MSETRMAGDALTEKRKSQLEERLGDEEFSRIGAKGLQGGDDKGRYNAAEVKAELRGGQYGDTVDERVEHFKQLQADGVKFNNRAQKFLQSKYGFDFTKNNTNDGNSDDGTNTGGDGGDNSGGGTEPGNGNPSNPGCEYPAPGGSGSGGGNASNANSTKQTIGDVSINGDGNIVNNSNSNAAFQQAFGGDSHSFTYNGGGGGSGGSGGSAPSGLYDTPASMATMAGYWGPKDSAKDTNEFLSKYIGGNRFHQAAMRSEYNDRTDIDYKTQAAAVNQFNPLAMQERIDREPLINRSRSTVDFAKLFGDVDNWQMEWTPTTAPKPIESEVGDIADEYKDELD